MDIFALGEGFLALMLSIVAIVTMTSSNNKSSDIINYRGLINQLKIEKSFMEQELERVKKDRDHLFEYVLKIKKEN